jgi:pimeloyl-ACP methyl ester carboxylesterase
MTAARHIDGSDLPLPRARRGRIVPMPTFERDGLTFHYLDRGAGLPLVVHHGLGGDTSQPGLLFDPPPGFRLVCPDGRGHGRTTPLGDAEKVRIGALGDDLIGLLDHLGIAAAIVGGISMGAAVALNVAMRHPRRVLGLVLSRPAWLDQPLPDHLAVFPCIARLIEQFGPVEGQRRFLASDEYRAQHAASADGARGLAKHFEHPRAPDYAVVFDRIPRDVAWPDRRAWSAIAVPTLVMANRLDPIHPFEYGEELARLIPNATFREITPKSVSLIGHGQDVRAALAEFLLANYPEPAAARA